MPRRRSAPTAAGEEGAQCPMLQLVMEKGPLEGQISNFKPGSSVKIGRIARGNTLAIKDAGVSSKHLIIQVEPTPEGGHKGWSVTDLGSSNGTFLNGEQLEELEPAVLSDGDAIKIGEKTSIRVKLEVTGDESRVGSTNVRRNIKRGKGAGLELRIIDEESELGLGDYNCLVNESINEKQKELGAVVKENVRGRRTRGSVDRDLKNVGDVEVKMESVEKVSLRRTRSSKKDEILESLVVELDEDNEKPEVEVKHGRNVSRRDAQSYKKILSTSEEVIADRVFVPNERDEENEKSVAVAEVEVKRGRNLSRRGTRSSQNNVSMSENLNADGAENLGTSEAGGGQRVSVRRTRGSRKAGIGEAGIDLSFLDGKQIRKGTTGSKKIPAEIPEEKEENNLESKACEEVEREMETGVDELAERVNSGKEGITELASTSGVKESAGGVGNGKETVVDLETMTMEEWFHYLEVFLPKQIVDATEEMISEMKQKAERLNKYMLHQKKC